MCNLTKVMPSFITDFLKNVDQGRQLWYNYTSYGTIISILVLKSIVLHII